ncbi:MAG: hypothetical protein FJ217_15355 [Ignavibacteria bacterium]|nr:hypothetical protein [Ignavibacteria bacterium]
MTRLIVVALSGTIQIPWKEILAQVLAFVYSLAHYVGLLAVYLLGLILPNVKVAGDLVDPIGYLAVLTAFLILIQVAKKVAWIVVIVGWALILVRILLVAFGY